MKQSLLSILFLLVPILASADAVKINGIYYNLISKAKLAEVTKNPDMYTGDVVIPESVTYEGTKYRVTSIGFQAFLDCYGLTSIDIPNSVTSIGEGAFGYCSGLTSIDIPSSVTSIGNGAFLECNRLTSVHISDIAAWCKIEFGDTPLHFAHHLYLNGEEIKDLVIPNSVTSLGERTFQDCSGLTSVTIPNSVTSIGARAFLKCTGLTEVTIPNSVTSLGEFAFGYCSGLISVTIPDNWTSIVDGAFCNCSSLTSFIIPNSVTSIGSQAFWGCSGLTSITIPNNVTSIEDWAFRGCSSLTSVTIPNNVTSIGGDAFADCSSLTSVTIGSGIMKIYSEAFASCPELTDVYCYATNVPKTWNRIFEDSYIDYATLHVPDASVDIYKTTDPWSGFGTIVGIPMNSVVIDKSEVIIRKNKSVTLTATLYPETLTDKSVTWKSSDKTIATVSSSGKVTGVKSGVVTITCTSVATGAKATCKVTVGTIALNKKEVIVRKNKSVTLKPTVYPTTLEDKSVKWKSSDKTIATVSSSGKVTGVKTGVVTITCTSNATGLSTTCKVTVGTIALNKKEVIVRKKKTVTLTPTVYPTSLEDKSVTWKSSDESVATVSSDGVVTGIKSGVITITCTSNATGLSTTCKVTVATIALNKSSVTLTEGMKVTLKPTVYPTTLEDQSVTWKSSKTSVAKVSSTGKVTAVAAGTATITCTSVATGVSTTCKVTVTASASARTLGGDDEELTDIEIVEMTPAAEEPFDVYDLKGHCVLHQVTSLDGLPAGVYIVNGKKMLKK